MYLQFFMRLSFITDYEGNIKKIQIVTVTHGQYYEWAKREHLKYINELYSKLNCGMD